MTAAAVVAMTSVTVPVSVTKGSTFVASVSRGAPSVTASLDSG